MHSRFQACPCYSRNALVHKKPKLKILWRSNHRHILFVFRSGKYNPKPSRGTQCHLKARAIFLPSHRAIFHVKYDMERLFKLKKRGNVFQSSPNCDISHPCTGTSILAFKEVGKNKACLGLDCRTTCVI